MKASLRVYASCAALAALIATPSNAAPLTPAQCLQAHQDVSRLARSLSLAGHCAVPGSAPHRPSTISGPSETAPSDAPCQIDKASIAAWMNLHGTEFASARAAADQCDLQACPGISTVPPQVQCRCNPPANPKNRRPGAVVPPCLCPNLPIDADHDGIPDAFEQQLIERFSPHLRFSLGEHGAEEFRPQDPLQYLQQSRLVTSEDDPVTRIDNATLQTKPDSVLSVANLLTNYVPSGDGTQCTNSAPRMPFDVDPLTDTPHSGASWTDVMAKKNIGIYAHVSKVVPRNGKAASSQDLAGSCPRMVNGSAELPVTPVSWYETHCVNCYRIEYYQFFGYNATYSSPDIHGVDFGNHEGDWAMVVVIYDAVTDKIVAVSHWAHGYEMRFDMTRVRSTHEQDDPLLGTKVQVNEGPNVGKAFTLASVHLTEPRTRQENPELAQDNEVRFARDSTTGEFSHPLVYVEHGAHEFWPTENGNMDRAPNHNGDDWDHHYEPVGIPNLGEIEHPIGAAAKIIVLFSGAWGHINSYNSPPPGPALHKAWNWFAPNRIPITCAVAE